MEIDAFDKNRYSHFTAKERDRISFPARWLWENGLLKGRILDFGCGYDKDGETLRGYGISIDSFDPYYKPDQIGKDYDTVMCLYVLNVLLPIQQAIVLMQVSRLVAPGGRAYFAVRRDLTRDGFRFHALHKVDTYQCTVKLPWRSVFINDFVEIYEYKRWDELQSNFDKMYAGKVSQLCETATVIALKIEPKDGDPYVVVRPKAMVANFFELSLKRQMACWVVVNNLGLAIKEAKVAGSEIIVP